MKDDLIAAITGLEEERVLELTKNMLKEDVPPLQLIEYYREGIEEIGEKFDTGEYFLAELVMGAEIFQQGKELILPEIEMSEEEMRKKILLGTVEGDVHNIGKDIFMSLAEAAGFEVINLGVDVPAEEFVKNIKNTEPEIVGMSCLLTNAISTMKNTIEIIRKTDLPETKIIIGGAPISPDTKEFTGADAYAEDAQDGLNKIKKMLE